MEGIINKYGDLYIKRGCDLKSQHCPFRSEDAEQYSSCGDWCPLFGEVIEREGVYTELKLCKRTLFFYKFEDKRNGIKVISEK